MVIDNVLYEAREALERLQYLNGCFCCQGIPADREHSESCTYAMNALKKLLDLEKRLRYE